MRPWTWTIAVDLRERSRGALEFARWLAQRVPAGSMEFRAAHVIQSRLLGARDYEAPRAQRARDRVTAILAEHGLLEVVGEILIGEADNAETWLRQEACHGPQGLIAGRAGEAEGWSFVSLGRVARRLLRSVAAPTIIVPPDYQPPRGDAGPVVVGLEGDAAARTLLAMTDWLSLALGVERVALHAYQTPQPILGGAWPPQQPESTIHQLEALGVPQRAAIAELVAKYSPRAYEVTCRPGAVVSTLTTVGRERDASVLVCGARPLGPVQRLVSATAGPQAAARADRPVLVLPTTWEPHAPIHAAEVPARGLS